jgi:hypothetical protein
VAFFVFGGTKASFSATICSFITRQIEKPFCFGPDVNSARISGAEQSNNAIKLRERHHTPREYMLRHASCLSCTALTANVLM